MEVFMNAKDGFGRASRTAALLLAVAAATAESRESAVPVPGTYGTQGLTFVNVHAYAFQPTYSTDLVTEDGNGYRYFGAPPVSPWMGAPVQLPSGVVIDHIRISLCSEDPDALLLTLYDNGVGGSGGGGGTQIVSLQTPLGCGEAFAAVPNGGYLYTQNANHPLYLALYWAGDGFDGATKFNNVSIAYRRAVSPAPLNATFNDVPVSHPFFQYVEALGQSGITGGCNASPPLYCPDAPLTRAQMAAFLAKALGLHWPF
jgi:hypothetical protein